jgi:hypothetical protein
MYEAMFKTCCGLSHQRIIEPEVKRLGRVLVDQIVVCHESCHCSFEGLYDRNTFHFFTVLKSCCFVLTMQR